MLELIDLPLPKNGFRRFISCWIVEWQDRLVVVDPGPSNSIEHLVKALGSRTPDFLLLTHLHIDHAGGAGALLQRYPRAQAIAWGPALKHLAAPEALMAGSQKVLGELCELYGEMIPIPEHRLLPAEHIADHIADAKMLPTPGHAAHHVSYLLGNLLFCGEALGTRQELPSGKLYTRPATPRRFIPEIYLSSIEALQGWQPAIEQGTALRLCFGHFGTQQDLFASCQAARKQITCWMSVVDALSKRLGESFRKDPLAHLDAAIAELIKADPRFSHFPDLPADIAERERLFIGNSLLGIAAP